MCCWRPSWVMGSLRRLMPLNVVLVLTATAWIVLGTATPARACSCSENEIDRESVLRRGGATEGEVIGVSEPYEVSDQAAGGRWLQDIDIAVTRAFVTDPGPRTTIAADPVRVALADGTSLESSCGIHLRPGARVGYFADVDVLSLCSIVYDGFGDVLEQPPPAVSRQPIRYLGSPIDPGGSVGGLTSAGAYVSQVALPSPGPLLRCPDDAFAVVQHGGGVFTGVEDISWSRLDLTTLAVDELVDISVLNPDPTRLQNVFHGAVCLQPDASDIVALFSWWEPPDEKPQRLVRITDGVVTELAVAPIWDIWANQGTVFARVGEAGADIVTVSVSTGAFTAYGTLPVAGDFAVAADGQWAAVTERASEGKEHTLSRVQLVPEIAVTAETTIVGHATPLSDGRTMISAPSTDPESPLEMLDERLASEATATFHAPLQLDAADGAWFLSEDTGVVRWTRGEEPIVTAIQAETILPVYATPAEPFPATELTVVTYDPSELEPPASPTASEGPVSTPLEPTAHPEARTPPDTQPGVVSASPDRVAEAGQPRGQFWTRDRVLGILLLVLLSAPVVIAVRKQRNKKQRGGGGR